MAKSVALIQDYDKISCINYEKAKKPKKPKILLRTRIKDQERETRHRLLRQLYLATSIDLVALQFGIRNNYAFIPKKKYV